MSGSFFRWAVFPQDFRVLAIVQGNVAAVAGGDSIQIGGIPILLTD
jgi:hypothetical protein